MKKSGIINSEIAGMGHMDWLAINDDEIPITIKYPKNNFGNK